MSYMSHSRTMQSFLVEPLQSADISTMVIINAFDECKDEDPESAILLVLGKSVLDIPHVKFLITSQPERDIVTGFCHPLLEGLTDFFVLHHVEPSIVDKDICHFFEHELSMLASQHSWINGWPTDEELDSLCQRAAGFFVYAVATVNFLNHHLQDPSDQLNILMASPESTAHEGEVELKVHTSLDALYMSIFQKSFQKNKARDDAMVCSILSAVVLVTNPLSLSAIALLMGFHHNQVQHTLDLIQSLLIVPEDHGSPIQPFHKSFPDFITDPTRCSDVRFYISPDFHIGLALQCLKLMAKSLKKNMCSIPDYALNSDVGNLPQRMKESDVHGALEYACRSWYKHLIVTNNQIEDVVSALCDFLEERFILWLEVLSALNIVGDAVYALVTLTKWLNEVCLN